MNRKFLKRMAAVAAVAALSTAAMTGAQAAEQSAQSEITGEIMGACTIAAGNYDFGAVSSAAAGSSQSLTGPITVNCSTGLPYLLWSEIGNSVTFTEPATLGGGTSSKTLAPVSNALEVIKGTSGAMGTVALWAAAGQTTAFPHERAAATPRYGTGADEAIQVHVSWTLPPGNLITQESFGKFKATTTFKVEF